MTILLEMRGRRTLLTGAGQGLGRGLALAFAEAGARVLVNDIRPDHAHAVVAQIRDAGGDAVATPFDVTDSQAVMAAVATCGPVDVLVNNAGNAGAQGFPSRVPFVKSSPEDWEPFLRVNLYGVLNCTHGVLPMMVAGGWGRIITIVSDAARVGEKYSAAYGAAKAGAAGLTRSVALEVGRYGITANNIALGTMRTTLTESLWSERSESPEAKAILRNYAIRRPGTQDDVALLAILLASEHGEWITGQTIPVNGGYSFGL